MKLSEAINTVIDLSRRIREYNDAEVVKRHKHYPLVSPGEEEAPPPEEEHELRAFLSALPADQVYQLALVMFVGQGYAKPDDLAGFIDSFIKEEIGEPADVVRWLVTFAPSLEDNLLDGLEKLRERKINVDRLPLQKVKLRKR